jgi:hypothetical protein
MLCKRAVRDLCAKTACALGSARTPSNNGRDGSSFFGPQAASLTAADFNPAQLRVS